MGRLYLVYLKLLEDSATFTCELWNEKIVKKSLKELKLGACSNLKKNRFLMTEGHCWEKNVLLFIYCMSVCGMAC